MHSKRSLFAAAQATMLFLASFAVAADGLAATESAPTTANKEVAVWQWNDLTKQPSAVRTFVPFDEKVGAGSVAAGDLGSDGTDEVVVGSGFGRPSSVRILRADGSKILEFAPFDADMMQGVNVAIGDLDGDGKGEIAVGTGPGAESRVRVFDGTGKEKIFTGGLTPFATDFRGGANVAIADVDGDGKADLITSAGPTGGPEVKVWNGSGVLLGDFFAFDNAQSQGLHIAAGDLDGDGKAEIIAALETGSKAYVRVFSGASGIKIGEFLSINSGFSGGLNLAIGDVDGNGSKEILVVPNGGGGPNVFAYDSTGKMLGNFFAYEEPYRGGVLMAVGRIGSDKAPALITVPAERTVDGRPQFAKYVEVDVSEQRLRAFEYGKLVKTFLVATGMKKYPSPIGDFSVLEKPYKVNYKWSYGAGNADNYDLGWVTWNLRFAPHVYIHYAPWRKVFGVRGSHGCINVNKTNAEWIYDWGAVGMPVTIQQ
jgi:hypothetical protein